MSINELNDDPNNELLNKLSKEKEISFWWF